MSKRLYKSNNDKVIAGVCGGVAEYFGIDSTLVRIGFVVGAFALGTGLLFYILAAIIIPDKPRGAHYDDINVHATIVEEEEDRFSYDQSRYSYYDTNKKHNKQSSNTGYNQKYDPNKRLYRSTSNRMIAGVCGGIGDYFGIDATIVRVVALALILAYGSGFLIYLIAWLIMPEKIY